MVGTVVVTVILSDSVMVGIVVVTSDPECLGNGRHGGCDQ